VSSDPTKKVVHVYDDIEEEDNHLPNWWLFILFATIVFGFGYWFLFHTTGRFKNPGEVHQAAVEELLKARISANPTSPEAILALAKDPTALAEGKQVFTSTCAACHGFQGEGIIGPNLTDNRWIHGYGAADFIKAVNEGYPAKGMPAWGPMIGPDKSRKVAAYVLTLKGTNVAGKAPQGDLVE
jgi:cytochrome c oxidase cbb3-type subunit 3